MDLPIHSIAWDLMHRLSSDDVAQTQVQSKGNHSPPWPSKFRKVV